MKFVRRGVCTRDTLEDSPFQVIRVALTPPPSEEVSLVPGAEEPLFGDVWRCRHALGGQMVRDRGGESVGPASLKTVS